MTALGSSESGWIDYTAGLIVSLERSAAERLDRAASFRRAGERSQAALELEWAAGLSRAAFGLYRPFCVEHREPGNEYRATAAAYEGFVNYVHQKMMVEAVNSARSGP